MHTSGLVRNGGIYIKGFTFHTKTDDGYVRIRQRVGRHSRRVWQANVPTAPDSREKDFSGKGMWYFNLYVAEMSDDSVLYIHLQ